jgi:hypothetical protein
MLPLTKNSNVDSIPKRDGFECLENREDRFAEAESGKFNGAGAAGGSLSSGRRSGDPGRIGAQALIP